MDDARTLRWSAVGEEPLGALLRPGGLVTFFQPIVEVTSRGNALWSVECLTRAPDVLPFASAREMFAYVRQCGAEIPMDRACIREALRTASMLSGVPRFCLNVHARTLADDRHFATFLAGELRRAGFSPRRVAIEVLAPSDLTPALFEAIEQLRSIGIAIGIGDAGLSTTDYEGLVECRPDYLKVDRCFVRRGPPDDLREVVLEGVVRLAEGIGAAVVAQGVETAGELDAVLRQGILIVQGHLFGAAASAENLARSGLLRRAGVACG
jgi:EAL domain-containing protein (putative c-di-GMP-specific phosphodiesterase class I)